MNLGRVAFAVLLVIAMSSSARADDGEQAASISFDVGLFAGAFFASADHEFYDPTTSAPVDLGTAELDLGLRASAFLSDYVGVETELSLLPQVTSRGGSIIGLRGHVIGQYPAVVTPFAVAGLGAMGVVSDSSVLGDDSDTIAYAGVGARYQLWDAANLRIEARAVGAPKARSFGGETTHFEVLFGASWTLGSVALPHMSNPAAATERPPEPEPEPEPAADTDGDGLLDPDDACPTEAEVVNAFEDDDGCPDEVPDTDGDGIRDDADECKDAAEDFDGFEDTDGCPDTDNDGDTLLDADDQCPDAAGPADNGGCPDTDRDGDGVVDRLDNCPDEAGTAANQGCVAKQLVIIKGSSIQILETIHFRTNKATIQSRSYKLLDNVAAVLMAHPELTEIEVAGHTDDIGTEEFNQWLSDKRAGAVVDYLVDRGVAADRLVAVGYGESQPAVEGKSAKARTANRRVEFEVRESTILSGGANDD